MDDPAPNPLPWGGRRRRRTVAFIGSGHTEVADLTLGPSGLHVHRLAVRDNAELGIDPTEPERTAAGLAALIGQERMSTRLVSVGLPDASFDGVLCELPKARNDALAALISRRVRERLPMDGGDVIADPTWTECAPDPDGVALRGFLAWSSRSRLEALERSFRAEGLHVESLVPPSLAVFDLVARTHQRDASGLAVCLRIAPPAVHIAVYSGTTPLYGRFLSELLTDAEDGEYEEAVTELHRTVAFVKQNHRGQPIENVFVSGLEPEPFETFAELVRRELDLSPVPVRLDGDPPAPQGREDAVTTLAALLFHASGPGGARRRPANLLPPPPERVSKVTLVLIAMLLAATASVLGSLRLARSGVTDVRSNVHWLEWQYGLLAEGEAQRLDALETARAEQSTAQLLEAVEVQGGSDPIKPLMESVLALPPDVQLREVTLDNPYPFEPSARRIGLHIVGDLRGSRAQELQVALDELRTRPWCIDAQIEGGDLASSEDDAVRQDAHLEVLVR